MGDTISYSGGGIPYVDKVVEITPDTPLPDTEAISEIKALRALLEEKEHLIQAWEEAVRRTRSAYPEFVFGSGPPWRTRDAESAEWARRVCDNIVAEAKAIFEASEAERS